MSEAETKEVSEHGLPRFVTIILGVAGLLLALVLMREFSGIIAPAFMALNLIIAAYPVYSWLAKRGTPKWLAALVMGLVVMVLLLAAVAALVWSVTAMINEIPAYQDQFLAQYTNLVSWIQGFYPEFDPANSVVEWVRNLNTETLAQAVGNFASVLGGVFSGVWGGVVLVGAILAVMIFLAMDAPGLSARLHNSRSSYPQLGNAIESFIAGVRKYWVITTVFGLIVAVLDGIVLQILGVPMAWVWALFSFLTNYIPNIGFVMGLVPPALLAWITGGWQIMLIVIIAYSVLNFVIQSVIQPRIAGESVGVSATVSFVSLLVWGSVLGGLGTLIALPMTLLVKALLIDIDPNAKWLDALITAKSVPKPGQKAILERKL